jgi:hypothetical protein
MGTIGKIVWLISTLAVSIWPAAKGAETDVAVIAYYLQKLDSVMAESPFFDSAQTYVFKVKSIYRRTDYRGNPKTSDTAVFQMESFQGSLKILAVIDSGAGEDNQFPPNFRIKDFWRDNLDFYFFPNDIGSGLLAIGFDNQRGSKSEIASGILTMDREKYYPLEISLYFPEREGMRNYSEIYNFIAVDNHLVISSLRVNYSIMGVLGAKYIGKTYLFDDYIFK